MFRHDASSCVSGWRFTRASTLLRMSVAKLFGDVFEAKLTGSAECPLTGKVTGIGRRMAEVQCEECLWSLKDMGKKKEKDGGRTAVNEVRHLTHDASVSFYHAQDLFNRV